MIPRLKLRRTFHGSRHEEDCDAELKEHRLEGLEVERRVDARREYWRIRRMDIIRYHAGECTSELREVQSVGYLNMAMLSTFLLWQWHAHHQALQKLLDKAHKAAMQEWRGRIVGQLAEALAAHHSRLRSPIQTRSSATTSSRCL